MMRRIVRNDIAKCQSIYYHPDYYLFGGRNILSCDKKDGTIVEYIGVKDFLESAVQLPNSRLLVSDSKKNYHVLDLKNGDIIATKKMRRDVIDTKRFAISNDGKTAFRIWLRGSKYELVVIDLMDLSYQVCTYSASLRYVADLVYSTENELLVLETQVNDDGTSQNQVTLACIEESRCKTLPKYTWVGENVAKFFDGQFVWESGYMIRELESNKTFSLLENSVITLPEKHSPTAHIYYPKEELLQIIDCSQNVFIDCNKRAIIARYLTNAQTGTYRGIVTSNEFWIGSEDGIYAKPFPIIESL